MLGSGHLAAGAPGKATSTCAAAATHVRHQLLHPQPLQRPGRVSALVSQLVRTDGIHHVTGAIEGDESYFDSLRGEPSSDFGSDPFLEGTLSGLAFNRGAVGSERGPHAPAAYAAHSCSQRSSRTA